MKHYAAVHLAAVARARRPLRVETTADHEKTPKKMSSSCGAAAATVAVVVATKECRPCCWKVPANLWHCAAGKDSAVEEGRPCKEGEGGCGRALCSLVSSWYVVGKTQRVGSYPKSRVCRSRLRRRQSLKLVSEGMRILLAADHSRGSLSDQVPLGLALCEAVCTEVLPRTRGGGPCTSWRADRNPVHRSAAPSCWQHRTALEKPGGPLAKFGMSHHFTRFRHASLPIVLPLSPEWHDGWRSSSAAATCSYVHNSPALNAKHACLMNHSSRESITS